MSEVGIKGNVLTLPSFNLDGETHESSSKKMDLLAGAGQWVVVGTYKGRTVMAQTTVGFKR